MQTHTVLGEAMLSGIAFLKGEGLKIVRSHHERWDGRGYPDGLSAGEIPLGARIFAVADALDAMTSHRPYRRAMSWQTARTEILSQRKRQFDPDVVDAFVSSESRLRWSGVGKTRRVGLSGVVASLVVAVLRVTRRVTGRRVRAFRMIRPRVCGGAGLAPAAGLIRSLSALWA